MRGRGCKNIATISICLSLILCMIICSSFLQFSKDFESSVSATTETILSISGNLYNEDGSFNYQNVQV